MGTFPYLLTLIGPTGRTERLEARVGTGATFTTLPAPILKRLGVRLCWRARPAVADGKEGEWPMAEVVARLDGQERTILCIFGPPGSVPLLGAPAVEAFLLTVDFVEKRSVPKEQVYLTVGTG
ncbi:MAG: hypothetical protein NZ951_04100 [Dehalococcoidia bacterium]|nr:hypothetical protein [Dehalococcoidia bacterium]MDW8120509.1 hypothetical protein [Chloroflexota bacterium]